MNIALLSFGVLVLSHAQRSSLHASSPPSCLSLVTQHSEAPDKLEEALRELKSEAEAGSAYAMLQLSRRYSLHQQREQASQWHARYVQQLQSEAERGESQSMLRLAALYLRGSEFLMPQREQAKQWLERASKAGEPSGAYILADMLEKQALHQQASVSYKHSYELYQKRLDREDTKTDTLYWLGTMELLGQGVEKNEQQAIAHLGEAAARGSRPALERLFHCYITGTGVAKNKSKALNYARELADKHKQSSMALAVATSYLEGDDVPQDEELASRYLQLACDLQNPAALSLKGRQLHQKGDTEQALKYLLHAAKLGDARAHTELGTIYLNEKNPPFHNEEEALKHLHIAADLHSDPSAAHLLASCYDRREDEARANSYVLLASNGGLREATAARGLLHMLPHSEIEWNPTLAYQWWKLGSEAGDPTATRYLRIFLYGVVPAVLFTAFLLPILLMRYIIWRRKNKKS